MIIEPVAALTTGGTDQSAVISMPGPTDAECIWDSETSIGVVSLVYDIQGRLGADYSWENLVTGATEASAPSVVRVWPEMRVSITTYTPGGGSARIGVSCPWGSRLEGAALTG